MIRHASIFLFASALFLFVFLAPGFASDRQSWESVYQEANSLLKDYKFDSANIIGREALTLAEDEFGKDDTTVAKTLILLGEVARFQADSIEGKLIYDRAIDIYTFHHGPISNEVANAIYRLGALHCHMGNYEQAKELFNRSLDIKYQVFEPDHPEIASSMNGIAIVNWYLGNYAEAEKSYLKIIDILLTNLPEDDIKIADIQGNLAALYGEMGRYLEAERLFKKSIKIQTREYGANHPKVAAGLNNLANIYKDLGKFLEAEELCKKAIRIKLESVDENHIEIALQKINLALIYYYLGKFNQSEELNNEALEVVKAKFKEDHQRVANILNNQGSVFMKTGRLEEAEHLYRQALSIRKKALGHDSPVVATTLGKLAEVHFRLGKYETADSLYQETLGIMEKTLGIEHPDYARQLNGMAIVYESDGQTEKAEQCFIRALDIMESALGPDHPDAANCYGNLGYHYLKTENYDKSLKYFGRFVELRKHYLKYVFSLSSESQKLRWVRNYPPIIDGLLILALNSDDEAARKAAFEMVLTGKGSITDAVVNLKKKAYCEQDYDVIARLDELSQLKTQIATMYMTSVFHPGEFEIDYQDSMEVLKILHDSINLELNETCTEYSDELAFVDYTTDSLTGLLDENTVLWDFIRCHRQGDFPLAADGNDTESDLYLAFTVNHAGEVDLHKIGTADLVDSLIESARDIMSRAKGIIRSQRIASSERELNKVTGRLFDVVFEPLIKLSGPPDKIIISPDSKLNLIPFEIFTNSQNEYVLENYTISYLSSSRDLVKFNSQIEGHRPAFIIADPDYNYRLTEKDISNANLRTRFTYEKWSDFRSLTDCYANSFKKLQFGLREANSISKLITSLSNIEVRQYYDSLATEDVIKSTDITPYLMHIVTHGFFCEDDESAGDYLLNNPLLKSALAMAGANQLYLSDSLSTPLVEDGILTALEISEINLMTTELAVLSACETGLGKPISGEGVFGLRRAFTHSGVQSLIMSLWEVPDIETTDLMIGFYKRWLGGSSKCEALREAALEIMRESRKKYDSRHPLLWGGFILIGNPN